MASPRRWDLWRWLHEYCFCVDMTHGHARDRREGYYEQYKASSIPCPDFNWPDTLSNKTPI